MSSRYEFIDGEEGNYPMVKMFAWAGVSSSGFYEWRNRPASATAERREKLKILIAAIFVDSDGTYGYRRIHAVLSRSGIPAGRELIRALMGELGLVACQPKAWRGDHHDRRRRRRAARLGPAGLQRHHARHEARFRHYLYPYLAGLALPRDRDRLRHQGPYRICNGRPHEDITGYQRRRIWQRNDTTSPARYSIQIAEPNICPKTSPPPPRNTTCVDRSDAPASVTTMLKPKRSMQR